MPCNHISYLDCFSWHKKQKQTQTLCQKTCCTFFHTFLSVHVYTCLPFVYSLSLFDQTCIYVVCHLLMWSSCNNFASVRTFALFFGHKPGRMVSWRSHSPLPTAFLCLCIFFLFWTHCIYHRSTLRRHTFGFGGSWFFLHIGFCFCFWLCFVSSSTFRHIFLQSFLHDFQVTILQIWPCTHHFFCLRCLWLRKWWLAPPLFFGSWGVPSELVTLAKLLCTVGFEGAEGTGAEGTCWEGATFLAGLLKSFSSNSLNTLEKPMPIGSADVATIAEELLGLDGANFLTGTIWQVFVWHWPIRCFHCLQNQFADDLVHLFLFFWCCFSHSFLIFICFLLQESKLGQYHPHTKINLICKVTISKPGFVDFLPSTKLDHWILELAGS